MAAKKRSSGGGCLAPTLIVCLVVAVFGTTVKEIFAAFAADPTKLIIVAAVVAVVLAAVYGVKRYLAWEQEQFDRKEAEKKAAEAAARANQEALDAARRKRQLEEQEAERQRQLDALCASIPLVPARISDVPAKRGTAGEHNFATVTKRTRVSSVSNFVVVDVETTGFHPRSNEIVEVAAIRFEDFEPIERFESLCFPQNGIDPHAAEVNGITEDMVAGQPTFQQIAASLQDFIGASNVVGHNLDFDLKFLESYGVDFGGGKRKYFDTLALSRSAWPDAPGYKLKTLCWYVGVKNAAAHRSFGDALATGQLFEKIVRKRTGDID